MRDHFEPVVHILLPHVRDRLDRWSFTYAPWRDRLNRAFTCPMCETGWTGRSHAPCARPVEPVVHTRRPWHGGIGLDSDMGSHLGACERPNRTEENTGESKRRRERA